MEEAKGMQTLGAIDKYLARTFDGKVNIFWKCSRDVM